MAMGPNGRRGEAEEEKTNQVENVSIALTVTSRLEGEGEAESSALIPSR